MQYMLANILLAILPPTRFFSLKRILLRLLGIQIGDGTSICGGTKFFGGGKVKIGSNCWIGINCRFYTADLANIDIGDRCDIAPENCFMTGSHEMGGGERRAGKGLSRDISIGAGTWLGVACVSLGGTKVGSSCMVAARSLLTGKDYGNNLLLIGSPAKVKRVLI